MVTVAGARPVFGGDRVRVSVVDRLKKVSQHGLIVLFAGRIQFGSIEMAAPGVVDGLQQGVGLVVGERMAVKRGDSHAPKTEAGGGGLAAAAAAANDGLERVFGKTCHSVILLRGMGCSRRQARG